jgi:hypothetical protein
MDFIKNTLPPIVMFVCSMALYVRISSVETNVEQRIENTINRLMPKIDTARRVVAPQLQGLGTYYYFTGKVTHDSKKLIHEFKYDVKWPREIWEGYVTRVKADSGAEYYMWSQTKITKGIEISVWVIADPVKWEIGYHKEMKDKIYGQILYPITPVNKPNSVTF